MGTAQNKSQVLVMDARKFVRHINNGASAKLKFFEEAVERMGAQAGTTLRLTSLDTTSLIFEDTTKNLYYIADIKKANNGRVDLDNVRQIQIVEEEKQNQFHKNCVDLVESISSGDLKSADKTFGKIESQRYGSRVIPESGYITPRDGVTRKIDVSSRIVNEDHVQNIIKLFTESVKDRVELENGRIVKGTLSDGTQKFTIPINEYTRRRLVANKMKQIAESAYKSQSFQKLVTEVASLVCEDKIKEACSLSAKFLKEEQEFCLLNSKELTTLVENALAACGEFNSFLAKDAAKVLHKTNLRVNKESIVESWTKAAQKSENTSLLTNVGVLSESNDFEKDYDKFLDLILNEEMDIQQARAKAYRTTLRIIAGVLPDLEDDSENKSASVDELNELVERLSGSEPDTDAILQAEELLAGISDSLVDNIQTLEGFDREPGEQEAVEEPEGEGELVPLPEVGGDEGEEGELGAPEAGAPGEELPGLEDELGAEEAKPEGEEEEKPKFPPLEGKEHQGQSRKISTMKMADVLESCEDWRINGDSYLAGKGYESCISQLNEYVQHCFKLGTSANVIRESFEQMRNKLISSNGKQLLEDITTDDDAYSNSVAAALNGPAKLVSDKDPESDPDFVGRSVASEGRINRDYYHAVLEAEQPYKSALVQNSEVKPASEPLRMDELQGKGGLAAKSPQKSDGRSAGGEKAGYAQKQKGNGLTAKGAKPVDGRKGYNSTSGAAGGSTRMDDVQGKGGVADKSVGSTDGRSANSTKVAASESAIPVKGGDPAVAKGGPKSVGLSMGTDHQGSKGKGSVLSKTVTFGKGTEGDAAEAAKDYKAKGGPSEVGLRMGDNQGNKGLMKKAPSGKHPGSDSTELKPTSSGGDMSELQGDGGVAEAFSPETIANLLAEMDEACAKCGCIDCNCGCNGNPDVCTCEKEPVSEAEDSTDSTKTEKKAGCKCCNKGCGKCPMCRQCKECVKSGDGVKAEDKDSGPVILEMDDEDDKSEDIVIVAGKPNKVMDALETALNDIGVMGDEEEKEPDLEGGDITGAEVEETEVPDDLDLGDDDSESALEDVLSDSKDGEESEEKEEESEEESSEEEKEESED